MRLTFGSITAACLFALSGCMAEAEPMEGLSEGASPSPAMAQIEAGLEVGCDVHCTVRGWLQEERYEEAREALATHLDETPDVDLALLMTQVELSDEQFGIAYAIAHEWAEDTGDLRMMEQRARASLQGHDVETAQVDYELLIEALRAPEVGSPARIAHAHVGLATTLYNRGQLDEAKAIAQDVLGEAAEQKVLDPAHGWFVSALIAAKEGDDDRAASLYQQILDRHATEPASMNNLGCIAYRAKDLDEARRWHLAAYHHAGRDRRLAAIAWSNVAEIDLLRGDYEAAEEKLHEALATSRDFAGAHFELAVLYDLMDRPRASADHMRTALALDEQGVTRWNTSWFTDEWRLHFDALVAMAQGDTRRAHEAWSALESASDEALRSTARRHLQR